MRNSAMLLVSLLFTREIQSAGLQLVDSGRFTYAVGIHGCTNCQYGGEPGYYRVQNNGRAPAIAELQIDSKPYSYSAASRLCVNNVENSAFSTTVDAYVGAYLSIAPEAGERIGDPVTLYAHLRAEVEGAQPTYGQLNVPGVYFWVKYGQFGSTTSVVFDAPETITLPVHVGDDISIHFSPYAFHSPYVATLGYDPYEPTTLSAIFDISFSDQAPIVPPLIPIDCLSNGGGSQDDPWMPCRIEPQSVGGSGGGGGGGVSSVSTFCSAPSRRWFDPPLAEAFLYEMTEGSLFTEIVDFPTGFADEFEVIVDGLTIGTFGPGESVDFRGYPDGGVRSFVLSGIDPAVDGTEPTAFPLQLAFNTDTADFTMSALGLGDTNQDSAVDLTDLNNVRNNFGGFGLGDADGDGKVGLDDLNAIRNNFGATWRGTRAVPEPATWQLTLALSICVCAVRASRRLFVRPT